MHIIPRTEATVQRANWQNLLAQAVKDPKVLFDYLQLPKESLPSALLAEHDFPLRAPIGYLDKIKKGDLNDPLLKQVLPTADEDLPHPDFVMDPVGDKAAMSQPGLLHKYQGRALLVTTGACAVHCRYCFRRHFPYSENNPGESQWQSAMEHLRQDPSIKELILSGGDPLTLSDKRLAQLVQQLEQIPHLTRLRIHTRLPVVIPERIDDQLLAWIDNSRLKVIFVLHINHPNEIDQQLGQALLPLTQRNISIYNQAVLLKGVNDRAETLVELSEKLFEINVQPYYLHLLDKVKGASHFDMPQREALAIMNEIRKQLPGYLVPQLVREVEGESFKQPQT